MKSLASDRLAVNASEASFDSLELFKRFSPNFFFNLNDDWEKDEKDGRIRFRRIGGLNIRVLFREPCPLVYVNDSLTEALYGSNQFALECESDIRRGLKLISEKVSDVLNATFDASSAKVLRVDANRNHHTHHLESYLDALRKHEILNFIRNEFNTTVEFKTLSEKEKIIVYAKFEQLCKRKPFLNEFFKLLAQDNLRVERSLSGYVLNREVQQFFGSTDKTAGKILTLPFAASIVDRAYHKLDLAQDVLTFAERERRIRAKTKPKTATLLIDFLNDIHRKGIKKVRRADKNRYSYRRSQLQNIGEWHFYCSEDENLMAVSDLPSDDWNDWQSTPY